MSLIKKSDVKNHLSTRAGTKVFRSGLTRSDTTAAPESNGALAKAVISITPRYPVSPEAIPEAQADGSVGVPANAETSGKGSW